MNEKLEMPLNMGATYFLQAEGDVVKNLYGPHVGHGKHAMFIYGVDKENDSYKCLDSFRSKPAGPGKKSKNEYKLVPFRSNGKVT